MVRARGRVGGWVRGGFHVWWWVWVWVGGRVAVGVGEIGGFVECEDDVGAVVGGEGALGGAGAVYPFGWWGLPGWVVVVLGVCEGEGGEELGVCEGEGGEEEEEGDEDEDAGFGGWMHFRTKSGEREGGGRGVEIGWIEWLELGRRRGALGQMCFLLYTYLRRVFSCSFSGFR